VRFMYARKHTHPIKAKFSSAWAFSCAFTRGRFGRCAFSVLQSFVIEGR
jgi:hypothetical protein